MKRTAVSLLIVSLLLCAGCSRARPSADGANGAGNAAPGATASPPAAAANPPSGGTQPGTSSGTQPGTVPPRIRRVFTKADSGLDASFTATYRFKNGLSGETSIWRLAQDPPKFRFERVSGKDRELNVFDGKVSYRCQTLGTRRTCVKGVGAPDETSLGMTYPPVVIDSLNSTIGLFGRGVEPETATRTIGGRRLDCVKLVTPAGAARDRWLCLTTQGILGYAAFAEHTIALTELRSGARASEFSSPE